MSYTLDQILRAASKHAYELNQQRTGNSIQVPYKDDPQYWSGRGAITADINAEGLEVLYQTVIELVGQEAATNYVRLVNAIPILSVTELILSMENLVTNNWVFDESRVQGGTGVYINEVTRVPGLGAIRLGMVGCDALRDETYMIKPPFIEQHKAELQ